MRSRGQSCGHSAAELAVAPSPWGSGSPISVCIRSSWKAHENTDGCHSTPSFRVSLGEVLEFAFLASSQAVLMLLVRGLYIVVGLIHSVCPDSLPGESSPSLPIQFLFCTPGAWIRSTQGLGSAHICLSYMKNSGLPALRSSNSGPHSQRLWLYKPLKISLSCKY